MKKDKLENNGRLRLLGGRAAGISVLAATVFLCIFSLLEIVALKMEWNIPGLALLTGGSDSYIFTEYRNEEMALDDSTENELMEAVLPLPENSVAEVPGEKPEIGMPEQNTPPESGMGTQEERQEKPEDATPPENAGTGEHDSEPEEAFPYYIKINRRQNCITVYEKDENGEYTVPCKAIICSTGLYNATPKGVFHISNKYRWRELNGGVYGQYASRITGGVLFHSVPYRRKDETTLYPEKYNKLGQQASMGCVRLTVEDAKWIVDNCPSGTTVEVYEDDDPGPLGKPEAMKIDLDNPNKNWDPTDPNVNNPWHGLSEDE